MTEFHTTVGCITRRTETPQNTPRHPLIVRLTTHDCGDSRKIAQRFAVIVVKYF